MNRISISIAISVIVLIVCLFLGRLVLLAHIEKKIDQVQNDIVRFEDSRTMLQAKLQKIKKTSIKLPKQNGEILNPGEEAKIFKGILKCAAKNFKFQNYEELKTYFVKGKESDSSSSSVSSGFNAGNELPKLDDQGMPIGISVEDDTEWAGVEILPIKFSFRTTFSGIGRFLSVAKKELPLHAVKNMNLVLSDSGIVKGNIVFIFPQTERR